MLLLIESTPRPPAPRDDIEHFQAPPLGSLLPGDAAEVSSHLGARHRPELRGALALMIPPLLRALEKEEGRHHYLAGPRHGGPQAEPWRGRRLDYITYRGAPGGVLSPVSAKAQGAGQAGAGTTPLT